MADEQKFFEVTIPNTNVTIKFPEGTDPATIDQVMRQAHEQAMPKRDEAGMADRIKGMSHQQMVDTYRSLPKDDPFVGYLAEQNLSRGYYPCLCQPFASAEEALASLPEWDREFQAVL